jgi:pyrroloquinoline quinone biosynthesis protein D
MSGIPPQRPMLARHVRYRWDPLREEHQLILPEGMLVLNESAAAIVQLCDGRTTDEMIAALNERCGDGESKIASDVRELLTQLGRKRLLCDCEPPTDSATPGAGC